jgi:hypothetical protein
MRAAAMSAMSARKSYFYCAIRLAGTTGKLATRWRLWVPENWAKEK